MEKIYRLSSFWISLTEVTILNIKIYLIVGLAALGLFFGTKFYINNLQDQVADLKHKLVLNTSVLEKTKEQILNQQKQTELLITEIRELNKQYAEKEIKLYEALEQHKDWADTLIPSDVSELLIGPIKINTK